MKTTKNLTLFILVMSVLNSGQLFSGKQKEQSISSKTFFKDGISVNLKAKDGG